MLGKLQTFKLQTTKFYEKGHRCLSYRQLGGSEITVEMERSSEMKRYSAARVAE